MAINLLKSGQSVELKKLDNGLRKVTLGLRWGGLVEKKSTTGEGKSEKVSLLSAIFGRRSEPSTPSFGGAIDVDSAVILTDVNGVKVGRVYYGNPRAKGIRHAGDDRSGNDQYGEVDNEEIYIDLNELSHSVSEIHVVANIFSGANDFSDRRLRGSYVRLLNSETKEELVRYELEEFKGMKGVILGKIYLHQDEWKFKAIGQGVRSGSIDRIEGVIVKG